MEIRDKYLETGAEEWTFLKKIFYDVMMYFVLGLSAMQDVPAQK